MIYHISIYNNNELVNYVSNLDEVSYFKRSTFKEFLHFLSNNLQKQIKEDGIITLNHEEKYMVYCQKHTNQTVIMITDDFNKRIMIEHLKKIVNYNLKEYLKVDDKITKVNKELDKTIKIMSETVESILERGEKIEDLVNKSSELSLHSKIFYKTASDQNKCCIIS